MPEWGCCDYITDNNSVHLLYLRQIVLNCSSTHTVSRQTPWFSCGFDVFWFISISRETLLIGASPEKYRYALEHERAWLFEQPPSGKIAIYLDNSSAIFVLYLDMSKNNLEETISSSLQEMPSLGFRRLQRDNLIGKITMNFGSSVSCWRVSLANSELTGANLASEIRGLNHAQASQTLACLGHWSRKVM